MNAPDDLSTKICASSEKNDVNVKVFNIIIKTDKTKILIKHFWWDCKNKLFHSITCKSNKNGIMINVNAIADSIVPAKKIIVGILAYVFVRIVGI